MSLRRLFSVLLGLQLLFLPIITVSADATPTLPRLSSGPTIDFDNDTMNVPNHPLYIPRSTPVPNEGFRWNKHTVKVYNAADSPSIRRAFRHAVHSWNKVGVVHLVWTRHESKADIICDDNSLTLGSSNSSNGSNVGYSTTTLGSTETEFDPSYHVMTKADSTLDPNLLQGTSQSFKDKVAEHELGHALGLAHAQDWQHSVMVSHNIQYGITKEDKQTLKMMYK